MRIRKLFVVIFALFLTSCTTLPKPERLPLQSQKVRLFKVENVNEVSLLTIQFEDFQWRWVQTDPLGSPIARVILTKKGWQNDGFIMPNMQAKMLFSGLAVALNSQQPPFKLSSQWDITSNSPHFEIRTPDGILWKVDELEQ